jgi:transposase
MDCENEYEHIRKALGEEKSQRQLEQKMMVIELHEQGKSIRAIQEITGIPISTVGAWIKNTLPF